MVEVARKKYPLNPTLKLVNAEGRATSEFFRILTAIGDLIERISIEAGEVTTEMLEAEIIRVSTLIADEVIITGKLAQNAITDVTVAEQVGLAGPNGVSVINVSVPVTDTGTTGVLIQFVGFMDKPSADPSNAGNWYLILSRNGTPIDFTALMFYDDNFAYPVTVNWIDEAPGTNPTYNITTALVSGAGNFSLYEGVAVFSLLKR